MSRWDHNHAFWIQYQPLHNFYLKQIFFPLDSYYTVLPRNPGRKTVLFFLSLLLFSSEVHRNYTALREAAKDTSAVSVITGITFHTLLSQPWCNAGKIRWSLAYASGGQTNLPGQSYSRSKLAWMRGVYFPGNIPALKLTESPSRSMTSVTTQSTFNLCNAVLLTAKGECLEESWLK